MMPVKDFSVASGAFLGWITSDQRKLSVLLNDTTGFEIAILHIQVW